MRGNSSQSWAFQFNASHMELLRTGDPKAEEVVITAAFSCVDQFVRAVQRYGFGHLNKEDAEDIVQEFFGKKLSRLVTFYKFCTAAEFTAKFYTALRNFAYDWLDKKMRFPDIIDPTSGKWQSITKGRIYSEDGNEGMLSPVDRRIFRSEVKAFIAKWTDDPVRRWVLEVSLLESWTAPEVSKEVPSKFPGKECPVNTVYSHVYRIEHDPGFIRLMEKFSTTKGSL